MIIITTAICQIVNISQVVNSSQKYAHILITTPSHNKLLLYAGSLLYQPHIR